MLKTTSQQIIDSLGFEGNASGRPMVLGTAMSQGLGENTMFQVPRGFVLLVTKIVVQSDYAPAAVGTVGSPSNGELLQGISVNDAAGTNQGAFVFRGFARFNNSFWTGSPIWQTSAPSNVVQWNLKYAIPVPSGWSVRSPQNLTTIGNMAAVYGVVVTEDSARQLGYSVSKSATDAQRNYGVTSRSTSGTAVSGRAGRSIRVLDVNIRMQPQTFTANTLTVEQGDGTQIFAVQNDNPAEFLEMSFSPNWFLKSGEDLDITIGATEANSISITYEYVDEDEVPGDLWFSVVNPESPTPGTTTTNSLSTQTLAQSEATLYYPRYGTTKTVPTKGFQHFVRGYAVSMQKTATTQNTVGADDTETTSLAITSGATGGNFAWNGFVTNSVDGYYLSPVFQAGGHDQCVYACVEEVNIPCDPDDGSIWVNLLGTTNTVTTPTAGDADLRGCWVSLWGRTYPKFVTERTNEGS